MLFGRKRHFVCVNVDGSQIPQAGIHTGPILCEEGNPSQCYQPSKANSLSVALSQDMALLKASVDDLALSVSGNSRTITITNYGDFPATGLVLDYLGWPTGPSEPTVDASSTCHNGDTLAAHSGACTIVINPGPNATLGAGNVACTTGIAPSPMVVTVSAANVTTPTTTNVVVLGYGCQYQGGFVFSMDDSTPIAGSIGGKVAALTDQITASPISGIAWDANPDCATSPYHCPLQTDAWDFNIGLNLNSFPGSTNPGGTGTDGPGNTYQISSVLNGTNGNTNTPATYAAGVCISYNDGTYADWYLPAICEMGPDSGDGICNTTAVEQNIADNLSLLRSASCSGTTCLSGNYWSSTENSSNPLDYAWVEDLVPNSSVSAQVGGGKGTQLNIGVRCVRSF